MLTTLASPENPDIDKYALLLKPIEENPKPWVNAKGRREDDWDDGHESLV